MLTLKKFGVLGVVIFALSAISVANASAAQFTASATGSLVGKQLETQVFTFNGGQLKCSTAETAGPISKTADTQLHMTVSLKVCLFNGFLTVHVSPITFTITSNFKFHLDNTITINVTGGGCSLSLAPQTVGSVGFANNGSKMRMVPNVSGITYTATGGICGSSGTNGTYTGANEYERVGGGSLSFDP